MTPKARSRFRAGFTAPARQTGLRLSTQQRADLADALNPHGLTHPLLHAIEDRLYVYREKQEESRRDRPVFRAWLKRARRAHAVAQDLRDLLPLFTRDDDDLVKLLEQRATAWKHFTDKVPTREKHRPPNSEIIWVGLSVVEALAAAQVPLTLGRNTVVVEVLRLVRRWADELDGGPSRPRQNNYEFSRVIVESYRKNLRERRRVDAMHPRSRNSR